jgi:hypothetical protein
MSKAEESRDLIPYRANKEHKPDNAESMSNIDYSELK